MIWFGLALAFMALCAAALIVRPFLIAAPEANAPAPAEALRAELADIETSLARGDLDAEAAASARLEAERRVLRAETPAPTAKPAAPAGRAAAGAIAAFVLLGAGGLYLATGRPDLLAPPPAQEQSGQQELEQVIATLEQKLAAKPDDAEGWRALGWSAFILGDYDKAVNAYRRAIALRPDAPAFHSAYGEALVGKAQGIVAPAALAEFKRALALDPRDIRARFYVGLNKAQGGNAKAAIEDWFAIYREAPPDSDAARELRAQIEKLAAASGIDVSARFASGPSAADIENAARLSGQERAAMIDAMVTTLDERLRRNPDDLEGWIKLIRARAVQNKPADAADALKRARAAFAGDKRAQAALDQAAAEANLR